MLNPIIQFCNQQNINAKTHKLLIAVSGGPDSMALLDAFMVLKYNIEVAHVNYRLRPKYSDLDEKLVTEYCAKYSIKLHIHRANNIPDENIQVWARNMRYEFFENILKIQTLDFVCTAHHAEDQLETQLLGIFKGYELSSIRERNKNILRPILALPKSEILHYLKENAVPYRVDESNNQSKYDRNFVRNEVVPLLQTRFPNLSSRVLKASQRNIAKDAVLNDLINDKLKSKFIWQLGYYRIPTEAINDEISRKSFILKLQKLGFSLDQGVKCLTASTGSIFETEKYVLIKDQLGLILEQQHLPIKPKEIHKELIDGFTLDLNRFSLHFKVQDSQPESFEKGKVYSDFDKLNFPLTLRQVASSDYIRPFGMKQGKKAVLKHLKDEKVNSNQRAQFPVIIDKTNKIIIPNFTIDNDLRITAETNKVLILDSADTCLPFLNW